MLDRTQINQKISILIKKNHRCLDKIIEATHKIIKAKFLTTFVPKIRGTFRVCLNFLKNPKFSFEIMLLIKFQAMTKN